MATRSTPPAATTAPSYVGPFITVAVLFFIFGFITNLNMALVPHLRAIFDLPYAWAMLAESAFFLAYFVFASPTSKLIETIGYKRTMVVSLFIQVVGCLLFVPAAKMVSFPLFLTAVFVVGAGVTALQTAVNPYVAILGPEHSACPPHPGAGPQLAGWNDRSADRRRLHPDRSRAGGHQGRRRQHRARTLSRHCRRIADPGSDGCIPASSAHHADPGIPPGREGDPVLSRSIWSFRHTVLGAVGIFLYVGVEVGLASIAVNYFKTQGVDSLKTASFLVSLYWFGALVGRLLGSWMLTKIPSGRLLGIFGFAATLFVFVSMFSTGQVAIWAIVVCGFFNSIMFPNIFTLGIAGLGPMTSKGSGLIMTAVVGGAIVPYAIGKLADHVGIQNAFVIPAICYLFIAYYGLWGSKPKRIVQA